MSAAIEMLEALRDAYTRPRPGLKCGNGGPESGCNCLPCCCDRALARLRSAPAQPAPAAQPQAALPVLEAEPKEMEILAGLDGECPDCHSQTHLTDGDDPHPLGLCHECEKTRLAAENARLRALADSTDDETDRFNRGYERASRGEAHRDIEDEFELMGWGWFHTPDATIRADAATARIAELEQDLAAAREQEPVAWGVSQRDDGGCGSNIIDVAHLVYGKRPTLTWDVPLYAAPVPADEAASGHCVLCNQLVSDGQPHCVSRSEHRAAIAAARAEERERVAKMLQTTVWQTAAAAVRAMGDA